MRPIPDSTRDLLDDLEEHYPARCKSPDESLEDHLRYAGMVELIDVLRQRYEWTQENSRIPDIDLKGK